ncbi:MAG: hypothetical protein FJ096_09710 [Deltaproteobacteria bacterium]|nr:hypothetical protein [Deltaproteobacteria bacterium]
MKRSTLMFGVALAALLACNSGSADAEPIQAADANAALSNGPLTNDGSEGMPLDDDKKVSPRRAEMKKAMKAMAKLKSDENWDGLAKTFDAIKGKGAAGMDEWDAIAGAGAEAAGKKDADGVNKSCKGCHSKYQKLFKSAE